MYRHILVGLNQSAAAHRALGQAIRLAATLNATLTVMAVMPSLPLYGAYAIALSPEAHEIMKSDQLTAFAGLLEMARREARRHDIEIKTVLSNGSVSVSLFEAIRLNHIDLLVLGIHSTHDLPEWLSSSTAHKLAEKAPCDVLGVH